MAHVVARGTAVVRQAARDRQRARIDGADPENVLGEVQGAREAAVQVEVGDVVRTDPGDAERRRARGRHRR
jgi:hypothetical protein